MMPYKIIMLQNLLVNFYKQWLLSSVNLCTIYKMGDKTDCSIKILPNILWHSQDYM